MHDHSHAHGTAHHDHGGHRHHHDHGHAHGADGTQRYSIAVALNLGFVALEGAAGFYANSTALLSDAAHNLSDVLGLALAQGAAWLALRQASARRTYGFSKATVLAALANAVLLVAACGALGWEALRRLTAPQPIEPGLVMAVAAAGVLINGATALLFLRARKDDINARGAFLHMAADALVSLGVIGAGLAVWLTGAAWIDPAASLAVLVVILVGTWGLLRDSLDLTLDAAPAHIDVAAVRAHLLAANQVSDVHDLHVWAMSATETALTAHVVRPCGSDDDFLGALARSLDQSFGIRHVTIQVECAQRDDCAEHA